MTELADVRFLTVAEVADIMRVSKMTVYRLVHSGELLAVRFGRGSLPGVRDGRLRRPASAHRRRRLDYSEGILHDARSRTRKMRVQTPT